MDTQFKQWQELWQGGQNEGTEISSQSLHFRTSHTYIDKIRRNMRNEFYFALVFLPAALLYASVQSSNYEMSLIVRSCIVFMGIIATFYVFRFFTFYRSTSLLSFNTRESLLWFVSEMRLQLEVYRSFTYIMVLCGLFFGMLYGIFEPSDDESSAALTNRQLIWLLLSLFAGMLIFTLSMLEVWIYVVYGKYVRKLRALITELNGKDQENQPLPEQ